MAQFLFSVLSECMMIGSFVNVTLATSVMSTRNSVKLFDITMYVEQTFEEAAWVSSCDE